MMSVNLIKRSAIKAVADEVLPQTGLAYFIDEHQRTWPVTRLQAGEVFDNLKPGCSCLLTLNHYEKFTVVDGCQVHGEH